MYQNSTHGSVGGRLARPIVSLLPDRHGYYHTAVYSFCFYGLQIPFYCTKIRYILVAVMELRFLLIPQCRFVMNVLCL